MKDIKSNIGKHERTTQKRIIRLFREQLGYRYLGNWLEEVRLQPVEEKLLLDFLIERQQYAPVLARKAVDTLLKAVNNLSN
ncbi:MAG: hypothetical protein ACOCXV_01770, partial [Bacteroidota bacterium]